MLYKTGQYYDDDDDNKGQDDDEDDEYIHPKCIHFGMFVLSTNKLNLKDNQRTITEFIQ